MHFLSYRFSFVIQTLSMMLSIFYWSALCRKSICDDPFNYLFSALHPLKKWLLWRVFVYVRRILIGRILKCLWSGCIESYAFSLMHFASGWKLGIVPYLDHLDFCVFANVLKYFWSLFYSTWIHHNWKIVTWTTLTHKPCSPNLRAKSLSTFVGDGYEMNRMQEVLRSTVDVMKGHSK